MGGLASRLDLYIHDYLTKRQLHATARIFQAEGNVSTDPIGKIMHIGFLRGKKLGICKCKCSSNLLNLTFWLHAPVIDAPSGFLFEWWSVFWDIYIARANQKLQDTAQKHQEAAVSYSKV